jgi:AraC family ethanolamine operon transcriptional activator
MHTAGLELAYSDPTVVGQQHGLLSQDVVQLRPGPMHARCVIAELGTLRVVRHVSEVRVRTRTSTRHDRVAIVLFGPQARGTVDGLAVRSDLLLAAGPRAEAGFVAEPGWETLTFLVDPDALRSHAAARERTFGMPLGLEVLRGDDAAIRRLFESGRRCADAAAAGSTSLGEPDAEGRASSPADLLEAILDALDGSALYRPSRRELVAMKHHGIVRGAEAYALAHAGEPVYVRDLCRAVAVSERTLEYAFKATVGLGPVAYLAALRLHRARASLQRSAGDPRTVATIASEWGFGHPGEFARAYRQHFGESPSRTRPALSPDPVPVPGEGRADDGAG